MELLRKISGLFLLSLFSLTAWSQFLNVTTSSTDVSCYNGSDGTGEVTSVTGGVPPYTYQWYNNDLTPIVDSTNSTISGLSAGLYFVYVYDVDSSNFGQDGITILNGPNISILVFKNDVTCNGSDDGDIFISAAGGNPPLEYSIDTGTTYQASPTFSGLPPGNYNVVVRDSKGCTKSFASNPVVIAEPAAMSLNLDSLFHIDCYGADDGAIYISTTGGTTPYDFLWTGPGPDRTTEDISGLSPGFYSLEVTDDNGCKEYLGPLEITEPPEIQITSVIATNETCHDDGDGSITVTAVGGTGTRHYTLIPGPTNTTGVFNSLNGNIYSVSITDDNGCGPVVQNNIEVINPDPITITDEDTTSITCNGADDGTISVTATGGTLPLIYSLTPGSYPDNNDGLFTGIAPDNGYQVSVTDVNGCPADLSSSWDFVEPAPIALTPVDTNDVTCNGAGDGSLTVSASGGTAPYIYTLTPGPVSQSSGTFSGLSGGTYSVSVTDVNNCTPAVVTDLVINDPDPISIDNIVTSDITCFGDNDGAITVTASGGTGTLHYTLNPGPINNTDGNFTSLGPNTYDVSVTDDNGCPAATAANLDVIEPSVISITGEDTTSITCNGAGDGTIDVDASGGTTPLVYSLSPGSYPDNNDGLFTGITPDNGYQVSVTDANACPAVLSSTWDFVEPAPITLTPVDTNDVTCNGAGDGSLTVSAAGGTAPYIYTLTPGPVSQASGTFTGLSGGTYSVSVTDINNCTPAVVTDLVINDPDPISITFANKINITCNGADDGQIIVMATGGTDPLKYILKDPSAPLDSNATGTFSPLPGGIYSVDVSDVNSCPPLNSGNLNLVDPLPITITAQDTTPITCNGAGDGIIDVDASGGTPPLVYSLSPGSYPDNNNGLFTGIVPDVGYQVSVTDANGCPPDLSNAWDFVEPAVITLTPLDTNDVTCNGAGDGSLSVLAAGGTAPYVYTLTPGPVSQPSGDFVNLDGGTYSVSVTDSKSCPPGQVTGMVINDPAPISITDLVINDISCNGADDGSIVATASGGTDTLFYTLTPGPLNNIDGNFTGLSGNTYSLSITDVNACTPATATNLVVIDPPALSIDAEDTTGISCFGANDASIQVSASGGTGVLTYILKDPAPVDTNTSGLFTGLAPGTYSVEVDDENGCGPLPGTTFTFTEPADLGVSVDGSSSKVLTCYGDATGSLNINVSGGTAPYSYDWSGPGGFSDTVKNIGGLEAGVYSLILTDAHNCQKQFDPLDSITGPPEFLMSFTVKERSCYDSSDDTVWVNASGGTPPYQYDDGFGPYASNVFVNLGPGQHILDVIDANLCVISDTLVLTIPAELEIVSETVIDSMQKCNGDSNGIIILTGSGGTGSLEYSIDSGYTFFPGNTFTGLGGGNYYSAVRDQNGCITHKSTLLISNPAPLIIDQYSQDDILSCSYAEEGEIRIKAAGGTPRPGINPYLYVMDLTDTTFNGRFENLPAGPHTVEIYDGNDCSTDTSVMILAPPPLLVSALVDDVTTCYWDSSGSISLIATGGTGLTKAYVLQGDTVFSADTVVYDSMPGGSYDFTVIDSLGCQVMQNVVINSPDSLSTDSVAVMPVTCFGNTDGEIRVYGAGGTPPYSYILNPGADTNSTGIFTNLMPGDYTVSVHDPLDCKPYLTPTLTVIEPPTLVYDSSRLSPISCGGMNDGEISMFVNGGLPPYSYSVDTGASFDTASVATGLGPGTYLVVVKDAAGCMVYGDTLLLIDPPGLSLDPVTITDIAGCAGDSTGALGLSATGGTGALEYSIDSLNWQSSGSFGGLPAGNYTAWVRDSKSCLTAFPAAQISEPPPILATITTTTAMIPDSGSIEISASGGTGTLEYSIDSGATFTADTFFRVPSDIYRVVIRDANGCTYEESVYVSATPPLEVTIYSTNLDCYNNNIGTIVLSDVNGIGTVKYSIDGGLSFADSGNFTGLAGGSYYIHVTDSQRIFRDTIEIINPPPFDVTGTVIPATCSRNSFDGAILLTVSGATPPYSYLWSNDSTTEDLSGLQEMTYTVTITDQLACVYMESYEVTANVHLRAEAGPDTVVCRGAVISLNGSGGDEFTWSPEQGLSRYDIPDPEALVTDSIAYVLFTRDVASGCSDRDTVTLTVHPERGISAGQDTTIAPGQSITLVATGGSFDIYSWDPVDGLDSPFSQSTTATVSTEISYTVTGITEFGCSESDSMNIYLATGLKIYSGFTPNGDGINDFWDIDDIVYYPNATVKVFNRWGKVVFSSVGYADNQRWDGNYKGKELPTGTYYYIIDLKDGSDPYKGPVTIVR